MTIKGEVLENELIYVEGKIVDPSTGQIFNAEEIKKAIDIDTLKTYKDNNLKLIELGLNSDFRVIKDKRGNEYQSTNVKEGFHFVKVFKVDVRNMLEHSQMSIISRGFIYSCLAYLHFPTNTLVIDGKSPTNELLCEKFMIGKTKLYEVYKELEKLEVIKREKINGQMVIYINPFLHSCGLIDTETYKLFKDSLYNPINRGEKLQD